MREQVAVVELKFEPELLMPAIQLVLRGPWNPSAWGGAPDRSRRFSCHELCEYVREGVSVAGLTLRPVLFSCSDRPNGNADDITRWTPGATSTDTLCMGPESPQTTPAQPEEQESLTKGLLRTPL